MYKTLLAVAIFTATNVYANGSIGYRTQLTLGSSGYNSVPGGSSPSPCGLLTGDNRVGVIEARYMTDTVTKIESYNSGKWTTLSKAPFLIGHLEGDNQSGPIIAGTFSFNRSVSYMNSYSANTWINLPQAPFEIQHLAGDNRKGPIISNGDTLAILETYSNPEWNVLNHAPFPFGSIFGITGDNHYGVIAYGLSKIALLDNYSKGVWTEIPSPPVNQTYMPQSIISITGSVNSGVIVLFANGDLWYKPLSKNSNGSTKVSAPWQGIYNMGIYRTAIQVITGDVPNGIAFCHS